MDSPSRQLEIVTLLAPKERVRGLLSALSLPDVGPEAGALLQGPDGLWIQKWQLSGP